MQLLIVILFQLSTDRRVEIKKANSPIEPPSVPRFWVLRFTHPAAIVALRWAWQGIDTNERLCGIHP